MNRRWYFFALAALGVLLVLTQILLNIFWRQPIGAWAMLGSCGLGFVGFYGLDPKNAHDGGDFLVSSAVRIIGVIRSGRRSTDNFAAVVEPKPSELENGVTEKVICPHCAKPMDLCICPE